MVNFALGDNITPANKDAAARPGPAQPRWRRAVRWLAGQELWLTLPVVALLAFPNRFSPWACLAVPALWLVRWAGQGAITRRTPVDIPVLVLLLTVPVGLWASADLERSWPVVYQVVAQVALFYALVNTARSARWLTVLAGGLVLAALAVAALNLAEVLVLGERLFSGQDLASKGWLGVTKRNIMGGVLALLLPIPLAWSLLGANRWPVRAILGLATVVVGVSLLAAQTRGAWVGLAIAVLVIAIWRNRWFAILIPIGIAVLAVVTFYVGPAQMSEWLLALDATGSAQGRWELWQRGVYMIQDFPFTGVGLGTFPLVGDLLYPLFSVESYKDIPHVHNIYLQAGIDGGLPGLIAFVGLWSLALTLGWQTIRRARPGFQQALAVGLFGSVIVYLVHGLTDSISSFARAGIVVWGVLGTLLALWLLIQNTRQPERDG
jgi:putative inorganic carbon (HCO3(-)) transporter